MSCASTDRDQPWKAAVAGGCAGLVNGFFGGGGGMLLVPLLSRWLKLEDRKAFATSTAIILPLCAVSALIYLFRGGLELRTSLPYLLGGVLGGALAGRIFQKINMAWLRRGFALLVFWAGLQAAFFR